MKICIGLPNHIAGVSASLIIDWARRAEQRGFESVSVADRLEYPSVDAIVALSLAAGAAAKLTLVTNVLLAPLYPRAILTKQLNSLAGATGERLIRGVAPGARDDDYDAVGVEFSARGRVMDDIATALRTIRGGDTADASALPHAPPRVPILYGGSSKPTLRRVTALGDGWVAGGLRDYPAQAAFADRVRAGSGSRSQRRTATARLSKLCSWPTYGRRHRALTIEALRRLFAGLRGSECGRHDLDAAGRSRHDCCVSHYGFPPTDVHPDGRIFVPSGFARRRRAVSSPAAVAALLLAEPKTQ